MNATARALNAVADVVCRAQAVDRTPMGIAFAIDAAGLVMSPEVAAELAEYRLQFPLLRAKVAELESLVLAAGAAAEQRHQVYDPSEPPVGCFMTGPICALALADALADPLAVDVAPPEQASPVSAFAAADAHIRGDECTQCKPSNRLPEQCPEGQRLSRLAMGSLVPDAAAVGGAPC